MKIRTALLKSLFCFSVALYGFEKLVNQPLVVISTFLISYIISLRIAAAPGFSLNIIKTIKYLTWLIKEIFWSSFNVATIAWQPNFEFKPAYKWITTNQKDELGLVLYANSITLTPGTIAVETNDNNILIHALDGTAIQDLQSGVMDNKVLELIK
ncbi:MAG: putative monovalent cation/H+ antiporter subunit [Rickettsiaceae bacterium]|jgi:multicomponent Na+:H+ antiporter subunit E|nr:putative monovalent cation/H+ antiporter subunit [Rickettsiaceae bacterium]